MVLKLNMHVGQQIKKYLGHAILGLDKALGRELCLISSLEMGRIPFREKFIFVLGIPSPSARDCLTVVGK